MTELKADAFASTQRNASSNGGNVNPRNAFHQQPAVKLTPEAHAWLQHKFEHALARHGRVPEEKLDALDWPPSVAPIPAPGGQALLRLIVNRLREKKIDPADPATFLGYAEAVEGLGLVPLKNPGLWRQLDNAGMGDLNSWARENGLPAITGFIKRKAKGGKPGNGYFTSNGRRTDDREWWLDEVQEAAAFDWDAYL
jgi:hypothetical protein